MVRVESVMMLVPNRCSVGAIYPDRLRKPAENEPVYRTYHGCWECGRCG